MDGQITDRIDARLTEREREVVRRIAEGDTTDQVAARLFISRTTVDTHVRKAMARMGARNRAHLIALAYVVAHYFSLLIYQGQATAYLASDPLGRGSDLFGTASTTIDYGVISATGIWYVQVGALVAGHVSGLILAHDRAVAMYRSPRQATRSQYWMLAVMVGFTSLGLWLLSAAA